MPTLILVRHGKSDWSHGVSDRHRPLKGKGVRQAPVVARWLVEHDLVPDLAVVSVARRAEQTWDVIAALLPAGVTTSIEPDVYTFDGADLAEVVQDLPPGVQRAALVGHNPALEELVERLTGRQVTLKTSAVAVVELPSWGAASGRLRAHGKPAAEPVALEP